MNIFQKKLFIDFLLLPFTGILSNILLINSNLKLDNILFKNNIILIDYWFFIHVINANLLTFYYPYNICVKKFYIIVFSWEILENIIVPNIFPHLNYFKEDIRDSFGDIIAAIPSSYILYILNNKNRIISWNNYTR